MRILVTIPHFYRASPAPRYGSEIVTAAPFRARLLTDCLRALHAHCGERQSITSRDGEIRSGLVDAGASVFGRCIGWYAVEWSASDLRTE